MNIEDIDVFDFCTLKYKPEEIADLRCQYEGIRPGYHMNKKHWMSVCFHSDVPDNVIRELVRKSYETVARSLTRKE